MTSEPFLPTAALLEGDVDDGLISRFLRYLDRVMDVVLVVDRLDESLVVLGASLCWPLDDLKYLPVNVHRKEYRAGAKDDPLLAARLKQLLHVDERLFAFANARLTKQLRALSYDDDDNAADHKAKDDASAASAAAQAYASAAAELTKTHFIAAADAIADGPLDVAVETLQGTKIDVKSQLRDLSRETQALKADCTDAVSGS